MSLSNIERGVAPTSRELLGRMAKLRVTAEVMKRAHRMDRNSWAIREGDLSRI